MKKQITKNFIFYFGIFLLFLNCILEKNINAICSFYSIFICLYFVYYVYKNKMLLIIFICLLYFVYSICIFNYYDNHINNSFKGFVGSEYSTHSLNILLLFLLFLLFFLPKNINDIKVKTMLYKKKAPMLIGVLSNLFLIFILIYGFGRPETLGDRGSPSALYEYSIVIFIVLYYYYHNNIIVKKMTTVILFLFVFQNLIFGGRVTAIQLIFVYLIFLRIDNISRKVIFLGSFLGVFVMSLVGAFRGNILFIDLDDIYITFKTLFENKLLNDTAYSSYYTSTTFLVMKDQLTFSQIWHYAFMYLLSIPFGSIIKDSNLSLLSHQYVNHYFGGILPFFFYFYFGFLGVVFISFYLSKLFKSINSMENKKGFKTCFSIYIVSTVFRWFLYSPNNLFRGLFTLAIIYFFLTFILKLCRREIIVK